MEATSIMEQSFDVDQLNYEIFSLLENKFLFGSGYSNDFQIGKCNILDKTLLEKVNQMDAGKVRVLSIDGGGSTDGILAAKSLVCLEECLCRKYGNPDARIADFFDAAAGSGVGGVLAALLFTKGKEGRPIYKATEALQFLIKNRRKLVPSSSKGLFCRGVFRSSKVDKIFRRTFGESTLKDTMKPVLIPCYDLSTRAPFLFSRADALETDSYDFKMSEVCAATSADPTAVGSFEMSSLDKQTKIVAVDGGLAMNNPTAAAITHVLNNKQEFPFCDSVEDLLVVSLGNGLANSGCQDFTISPANFVKIGGEGASDMVDEAVSMAFGGVRASNYVRIQANGFNIVPRKSSNSSGIGKKLLEIAEEMLAQKNVESVLFKGKKVAENTNADKLELFAGALIKEHERRKSSVFPTVMFKQSSPRTSSATISTISSC
ncbi:hypothetical protein IFM89_013671 [Coptis chinensis]|uniref:Patatin n=1 Tax=Coptis chinensis TaxID=261450 RepID=A0A835IKI1_9MAGN|nr:hypothetical protein IFM89_013671 [Coptis chinensis]